MFREITSKYQNNFSRKYIDFKEGEADPFLIKVNGFYYLTFTASNGLRMFKSFDLLHFEPVNGDGLISESSDFPHNGYAPEIFYNNGYYYLICSPSGNGHFLFKSNSITGPFKKISDNLHEMIDGSFFKDQDEEVYLARAAETCIVLRHFATLKDNSKDFFDVEIPSKEAKIGRWNEGPHIILRYGKYYMTYTGTHFLSNAYRVEYVSGSYLKDLHYQEVCLLSTKDNFYGLGHSMNILGPNLDSYFISYHCMNNNGVRRFNLSRILFDNNGHLMINNADLKDNFNIERPDFETFVNGDFISEYCTNNSFSIEFNFIGKNVKNIFGYKDKNNYFYLKLKEKVIEVFEVRNAKEIELYAYDLKQNYNLDSYHSVRIQYKNKCLAIYLDNVELVYNAKVCLKSGKIGYFNNKLKDAYIATSHYAFGDSDFVEPTIEKSYIYNKDYKFFIKEKGKYVLRVKVTGKHMVFAFKINGKTYQINQDCLKNEYIDLLEFDSKRGFKNIHFNNIKDFSLIEIKKIDENVKDIYLDQNLNELNKFDVLHHYEIKQDGIYFENDRNAILTKNKYHDFLVETEINLTGNAIEDIDFVGLISLVNDYGKNNGFENAYSFNGYAFVANSKNIFIIDTKYNHSKILKRINNTSNNLKLKEIKHGNELDFYLNGQLIYSLNTLNKVYSGKIGIYNTHASGLFKKLIIKKEI